MTKLPCEVIRDLLPLYADDAASPASCRLVEEHLAGCPCCRRELEQLRRPLAIPADTDTSLLRRLRRRQRRSALLWGLAFAAVLFSVRLVKRTGLRWWYVLLWLLQAAGVGAAGYMEYYVQRRGNEAVFAYSVMSACLLAVVALALLIRSLGKRSRKNAADFIG